MGSDLVALDLQHAASDRRGRIRSVQPSSRHGLVFFDVSIGIDEHIEPVLENRAPSSMQLFNEARL